MPSVQREGGPFLQYTAQRWHELNDSADKAALSWLIAVRLRHLQLKPESVMWPQGSQHAGPVWCEVAQELLQYIRPDHRLEPPTSCWMWETLEATEPERLRLHFNRIGHVAALNLLETHRRLRWYLLPRVLPSRVRAHWRQLQVQGTPQLLEYTSQQQRGTAIGLEPAQLTEWALLGAVALEAGRGDALPQPHLLGLFWGSWLSHLWRRQDRHSSHLMRTALARWHHALQKHTAVEWLWDFTLRLAVWCTAHPTHFRVAERLLLPLFWTSKQTAWHTTLKPSQFITGHWLTAKAPTDLLRNHVQRLAAGVDELLARGDHWSHRLCVHLATWLHALPWENWSVLLPLLDRHLNVGTTWPSLTSPLPEVQWGGALTQASRLHAPAPDTRAKMTTPFRQNTLPLDELLRPLFAGRLQPPPEALECHASEVVAAAATLLTRMEVALRSVVHVNTGTSARLLLSHSELYAFYQPVFARGAELPVGLVETAAGTRLVWPTQEVPVDLTWHDQPYSPYLYDVYLRHRPHARAADLRRLELHPYVPPVDPQREALKASLEIGYGSLDSLEQLLNDPLLESALPPPPPQLWNPTAASEVASVNDQRVEELLVCFRQAQSGLDQQRLSEAHRIREQAFEPYVPEADRELKRPKRRKVKA